MIQENRKKGEMGTVEFDDGRKRKVGEKELELMQLCYEQGFLFKKQVQEWLRYRFGYKNNDTVRSLSARAMKFLVEKKLLRPFGDEKTIVLTASGYKLLKAIGYIPTDAPPLRQPWEGLLGHDAVVTDIRLAWSRIFPDAIWHAKGQEGRSRSRRPDDRPDAAVSFLWPGKTRTVKIAIEVETRCGRYVDYKRKFIDYEDSTFDLVIYFTLNYWIDTPIHKASRKVCNFIYTCGIGNFLENLGKTVIKSHAKKSAIQDMLPCLRQG